MRNRIALWHIAQGTIYTTWIHIFSQLQQHNSLTQYTCYILKLFSPRSYSCSNSFLHSFYKAMRHPLVMKTLSPFLINHHLVLSRSWQAVSILTNARSEPRLSASRMESGVNLKILVVQIVVCSPCCLVLFICIDVNVTPVSMMAIEFTNLNAGSVENWYWCDSHLWSRGFRGVNVSHYFNRLPLLFESSVQESDSFHIKLFIRKEARPCLLLGMYSDSL